MTMSSHVSIGKHKQTNQIDAETQKAYKQQFVRVQFRRINEAMKSFIKDGARNENQENGIDETRQNVDATVTVGEGAVWWPFGNHQGD